MLCGPQAGLRSSLNTSPPFITNGMFRAPPVHSRADWTAPPPDRRKTRLKLPDLRVPPEQLGGRMDRRGLDRPSGDIRVRPERQTRIVRYRADTPKSRCQTQSYARFYRFERFFFAIGAISRLFPLSCGTCGGRAFSGKNATTETPSEQNVPRLHQLNALVVQLVACSIESTPARTACLIPTVPCAWAATGLPSRLVFRRQRA